MNPELIAECCAEMRASLIELTKIPAGVSDTVESSIEHTALTLVELCAVEAGTSIGWDTNRRLARRVAGLRPDQAAALVEVVTRTITTVAIRAASQSGRPVTDLVDPAAAAVMAQLYQLNPHACEWVTAALTADPATS